MRHQGRAYGRATGSVLIIEVGFVLALAVAAPTAFSEPASALPAFPSAVPSQPGQLTGTAAAAEIARAQERYYASYGNPSR